MKAAKALRAVALVILIVGVAAAIATVSRSAPASSFATHLEAPGRTMRAGIAGDSAILVNGRRVTPAGRVIRTDSYAWGLAVSPDGTRAAVLNKSAFELIDLREPFAVRRVPPYEARDSKDLGSGSYMGCAFSPDGRTFYYGSANEGRIIALDVASLKVTGTIDLNGGG